jgi:hypothetical protein
VYAGVGDHIPRPHHEKGHVPGLPIEYGAELGHVEAYGEVAAQYGLGGAVGEEQQIILIHEISGGNMRAFKDGKHIQPLDLEKLMLES